MAVTAGSPSLNRHVPRTEAEGRPALALKVAKEALPQVCGRRQSGDYVYASTLGREALERIISILDAGDTQPPQDESGTAQAKPPETSAPHKETV